MNIFVNVRSRDKIYIAHVFLSAAAGVLFFVYMYLVAHTAFLTQDRLLYAQKNEELSSRVADLESQYLELAGRVTLETARKLGFREQLRGTVFINRENRLTALSISGNEL